MLCTISTAARAEESDPTIIPFAWRPPNSPGAPYALDDPEDQHRIVLYPGVRKGGSYPVVIGFHGTYKDKPPREYRFRKVVTPLVGKMIRDGEIEPVVLVLPVFRFASQNWPGFDPRAFKKEVEKRLAGLGIRPGKWFAFGHSGAAGCGGDGLNRISRIPVAAVGFFDTCLGKGWQEAVSALHRKKVDTLNVHSVENAGFRPKQRPEYQSGFDFGRAYRPLGLSPVECPASHPGDRLRSQSYRCAETPDRVVSAFVVDTGEGAEAHSAAVPAGLTYFLKRFLGKGRN